MSAQVEAVIRGFGATAHLHPVFIDYLPVGLEKPPLVIGPYEATQIEKERQKVATAEQAATL